MNAAHVLDYFEPASELLKRIQVEKSWLKRELLRKFFLSLTTEFRSEFLQRNLSSFQSFNRVYRERSPQIWQKPSAKLALEHKTQKPSGKLASGRIRQTMSGKLPGDIVQKPSAQLPSTTPSSFTLSWSHHVLLLAIKNPEKRQRLCLSIPALSAVQRGSQATSHRMDRGDQR